jgi:predicted HicB family RNase H-like nuclease
MKRGNEQTVTPTEFLRRPYVRSVVPEPDGSFRAEIQEFPGCIALGDTSAGALEALEEVATEWIAVALARGQKIPEPAEDAGYSGKLVLRLPKSLHRRAAYAAQRDQVSLNQFIVAALAEHIGAAQVSSVWTAVTLISPLPSDFRALGGGISGMICASGQLGTLSSTNGELIIAPTTPVGLMERVNVRS